MLKKSQSAPFTVFGIVRFFKSNNFCLKIMFSQAQHAISDFCSFFRDRCFFYASFFLICFHRSPNFTRNETFCEHKALLKVFGTMRLAGDLHQKNFSKNSEKFFSQFSVFCCFHLEKNSFRDLCVSLRDFLPL